LFRLSGRGPFFRASCSLDEPPGPD